MEDIIIMNVKFYKNEKKYVLNFGKINFFYGYSNSGKTSLAQLLESGLSGKDKTFLKNSISIKKDENNVIFIDSKESIIDHIKLNSKSYIKKYFQKDIKDYFDSNDCVVGEINNILNDINKKLKNICDEINIYSEPLQINVQISINNYEEIVDNFLKLSIDDACLSSSSSKELLIYLIMLLEENKEDTHIIIDDFDSQLDEESIIKLIDKINNSNSFFYLFTNKTISLPYTIDRYNVFNIREDKIFDFTNLKYIVKCALSGDKKYDNFEEYMLDEGYLNCTGYIEQTYKITKTNSIYNLGRMFVSKKFEISDNIDYKTIKINPSNENEKIILNYINDLINLN